MLWIEKSVTRDHCSASLGKPRDADQWPSWQIFLSTPYTYDRYLLYLSLYYVQTTSQRLTGQSLTPQMAQSLLQLLTEERTLRSNLENDLNDLEDELNEFRKAKQNGRLLLPQTTDLIIIRPLFRWVQSQEELVLISVLCFTFTVNSYMYGHVEKVS